MKKGTVLRSHSVYSILEIDQSELNMGLINKVDMVCLSPVGYGV